MSSLLASPAYAVNERGDRQKQPARFFIGAEGSLTFHNEAGLDSSKGEYAVTYTTSGGTINAQYHLTDFYFEAGVGLMRLLSMTVNSASVSMTNRVQWHVPVHARAYYSLFEWFGIGAGLTHLTETTMYLNGTAVPQSSYHQLFIDVAGQFRPELTEHVRLIGTIVLGLNVIPGRQHTYTIGDLLHIRAQFNLGFQLAVF